MAERRCWICRAVAAKNANNRQWEYDLESFDPIEEQDVWDGWDDDPIEVQDDWDDWDDPRSVRDFYDYE